MALFPVCFNLVLVGLLAHSCFYLDPYAYFLNLICAICVSLCVMATHASINLPYVCTRTPSATRFVYLSELSLYLPFISALSHYALPSQYAYTTCTHQYKHLSLSLWLVCTQLVGSCCIKSSRLGFDPANWDSTREETTAVPNKGKRLTQINIHYLN